MSESAVLVHGSQRSGQRKDVFVALNGARLLASIHIVLGHLYQSGYGGGYASSWGFSWVPWFFMLSGYVLTLARLASRTPDAPQPVLAFVQKRAAVIYPPFAFSLFLGLAQRRWEGEALPKFYHLAAQGVLAQSFVPWLPESTIQVDGQLAGPAAWGRAKRAGPRALGPRTHSRLPRRPALLMRGCENGRRVGRVCPARPHRDTHAPHPAGALLVPVVPCSILAVLRHPRAARDLAAVDAPRCHRASHLFGRARLPTDDPPRLDFWG
jgi:hypothetical protein